MRRRLAPERHDGHRGLAAGAGAGAIRAGVPRERDRSARPPGADGRRSERTWRRRDRPSPANVESDRRSCGQCGRTAAEDVPAVPTANATADAERRQLTVLFCDLVGSTALSARLDPEELRAVIGAYHRCVAAVIERAVRAGLQLVEAVPGLDTAVRTPLQVRVGIATGLVVVGDLVGEGASREQAVVGE